MKGAFSGSFPVASEAIPKATTINSFGDFERTFGGLWVKSSLGYAVRDFYLNGGSQAIIVRLFHSDGSSDPEKTPLTAGAWRILDTRTR